MSTWQEQLQNFDAGTNAAMRVTTNADADGNFTQIAGLMKIMRDTMQLGFEKLELTAKQLDAFHDIMKVEISQIQQVIEQKLANDVDAMKATLDTKIKSSIRRVSVQTQSKKSIGNQ